MTRNRKARVRLPLPPRPKTPRNRPAPVYSLLDPRLRKTPQLVADLIGADAKRIAFGKWPEFFPPEEMLGFLVYQLRKLGFEAPLAEGTNAPEVLEGDFEEKTSAGADDDDDDSDAADAAV
jgi:hypothetical protein